MSDTIIHRRHMGNKIHGEILALEKTVERTSTTLENLKNLKISPEIAITQKNSLQKSLQEKQDELLLLKKKYDAVQSGVHDGEIKESMHLQQKIATESRNIREQKKISASKEQKRKKEEMYQKNRVEKDTSLQRDMRYHYKRFLHVSETIPGFLLEKLESMPNNRGYIWKGCWFFGKKREEIGEPLVMLERINPQILHIHEYYPTEYLLFEKNGPKRTLIRRFPRKNKARKLFARLGC